jgi:peptidoglycan/xylan/chitin deacetylase (PgdA/CDA1 family)
MIAEIVPPAKVHSSSKQSLVLMYHRVTEANQDPYGICVHPENFARQLDFVRGYADIVPLSAIRDPSTDRRIAITFDDGYADNALIAKALLEAAEAYATMFVVTGKIDAIKEFWWDRLEQLVSNLASIPRAPLDVNVGSRITIRLHLESGAAGKRTLWTLHSALMPLPPPVIDDVLESLASALQATPVDRETHRPLSVAELIDLNASTHIEIGAHSSSHPVLPSLSPQEQIDEIAGSRSFLQDRLNTTIRSFAYPFGEYDEQTLTLVEQAGLEVACSADPGNVTDATSLLKIPRREVLNWTGEQFAERLQHWMAEG